MNINDPQYIETVRKYWHTYILGDAPMPDSLPIIRPEIWESWKRSKNFHITPDRPANIELEKEEFHRELKEGAELLRFSNSYLNSFFHFLKGTNSLLQLCSGDGCVLKVLADDEPIRTMASQQIARNESGVIVGEAYTGTNSTSLCLALKKPVQVFGEEHYLSSNHDFACSSAPIFYEQTLLGVLTIVMPRELYQHHTMGMVSTAALGIENEIKMNAAYNQVTANTRIITSTIEHLPAGIIVLDPSLHIIHYNRAAAEILKLETLSLNGKHLFNLLQQETFPPALQTLDRDIADTEFSIMNAHGRRIDVTMRVAILKNKKEETEHIVLDFHSQKQNHNLTRQLGGFRATYTFDSIIGASQATKDLKFLGTNAARSTSTVLILGESGVGKELVAQAIHNASSRADGPFVAVNCGSLPKNLIESELFGYESGAFTGANKGGNPGKFELANGGTLFLDEIGDMPLELQVTLLRVLQEQEVIRIGGRFAKKIDVKIIAATNSDLNTAVADGRFRSDLYYRLNVLNITIPPLRERMEDLKPLTEYFIEHYNNALGKNVHSISPEAFARLQSYHWPGNVRQLENAIERAINTAAGTILSVEDLPMEISRQHFPAGSLPGSPSPVVPVPAGPAAADASASDNPTLSPEVQEYNEIVHFLQEEKGHVKSVAQKMEIPISTLYRKLNKYNLNAKDYRRW